jgi:hypothetical protein
VAAAASHDGPAQARVRRRDWPWRKDLREVLAALQLTGAAVDVAVGSAARPTAIGSIF